MQQQREQPRLEAPKAASTQHRQQQQEVSGLTNKLHNTAENVLKLKLQLEGDIKQRDEKIAEYQSLLKSMRANLLTEQQHSESLSHKLQIELLKRGDVNVRIETTRNICSSLQQHSNYVAEALKRCFKEKDLIKTAQFEYISELEALMEKTEKCNSLVKSLTKERDELLAAYQSEKENQAKMLGDVDQLKEFFQKKIDDAEQDDLQKTEKVTKAVEQLKQSEEKASVLVATVIKLEQELQMNAKNSKDKEGLMSFELKSLEIKLEEKNQALLDEKLKCADLVKRLEDLSAEFQVMEQSKNAIQESDEMNKRKLQELALEFDKLTEESASRLARLEALQLEKHELEERLQIIIKLEDDLEVTKKELANTCSERGALNVQLMANAEEHCRMEDVISKCQNELAEIYSKFGESTNELQAVITVNSRLEREIKETKGRVEIEFGKNQALTEKLEIELTASKTLKESLETLNVTNASESGELTNQLVELKSSYSETKRKLKQKEEMISNLSTENGSLKAKLVELREVFKTEQECSSKKAFLLKSKLEETENELKSCRSEQNTLQESLQALKEDIEGVQGNLKETSDDRETLLVEKKELEKNLKVARSEKNSAEAKLKRLETKSANLEKEKKELKEKIAKARSENLQDSEKKDIALSEFEDSIKEKEDQIAEIEQSLNDLKAANEDELKNKEAKLAEMQTENKKLLEKLESIAKDKEDADSKLSKVSVQLADTINNLTDISSKYEAQKQKLKEKIKTSEEQLSVKKSEISKLQSQLSSQNSTLSTYDAKKTVPESPSNSSLSSAKNILHRNTTLQKPSGLTRKSILKGANLKTGSETKKLSFSDRVSYISLEDDETSSISSEMAPKLHAVSQRSSVPTTPKKQPVYAKKQNTPQKKSVIIDDEGSSETSSTVDVVHMDEKEVERRIEQIRSPAHPISMKSSGLSTPNKRMNNYEADAPIKAKKSRLGGLGARQALKQKPLDV